MKQCFICGKRVYGSYFQNGYGRITCGAMKCTLDPRQPKKLVEAWNEKHKEKEVSE